MIRSSALSDGRNNMIKYSVIIPVYNAQSTLERCLDSFVIQLRPDVEILVINDGSSDRSSEISHRYEDEHTEIRVLDKERHIFRNRERGEFTFDPNIDYLLGKSGEDIGWKRNPSEIERRVNENIEPILKDVTINSIIEFIRK